MREIDIQWQDPAALLPYERRIRAHPEAQLRRLAASIAAYGLDQPIVADGCGVIIKGHARQEAAMRLGLAAVPVLVRRDLAPRQVRALRIADNKCTESDWHWRALKTELSALAVERTAYVPTGFDPDELDALRYDDPPKVAFPEYDERVLADGWIACPHCGACFVR